MSKYAAKGTLLKVGDSASPEAFTTIAQIYALSGPSLQQEELDVTDHSSTDGWKEFIGGLKDGGEVSGELHFDGAQATQDETTGLQKALKDGTVKNYRITFTDGTSITFAALVKSFEFAANVGDKLTAAFALKVSGVPTWS